MKTKQIPLFYLSFLLMIFVMSCGKDDVPSNGNNNNGGTTTTKSAAKDITKFSFATLSPAVDATIDATNKTISATVPAATDLTKLVPTITISDKATISPNTGVAQDFSKEISYTVTAEDGSTAVWKVGVKKVEVTTVTDFTLTFNGLNPTVKATTTDSTVVFREYSGNNEKHRLVTASFPSGTDISKLKATLQMPADYGFYDDVVKFDFVSGPIDRVFDFSKPVSIRILNKKTDKYIYFLVVVNVPITGLTPDIQSYFPVYAYTALKEKGMTINTGNTPPNIEGIYEIKPYIIVSPENPTDVTYKAGYDFGQVKFKFTTVSKDKVTIEYSVGGVVRGSGYGYVLGTGNKFSVFLYINGKSGTFGNEAFQSADIISGEMNSTGIKDALHGFIITSKTKLLGSELVDVGKGRTLKDGDGLASKSETLGTINTNSNSRISANSIYRK